MHGPLNVKFPLGFLIYQQTTKFITKKIIFSKLHVSILLAYHQAFVYKNT